MDTLQDQVNPLITWWYYNLFFIAADLHSLKCQRFITQRKIYAP